MIAEIVAPPGLRSIASTEACLDDPASIGFDAARLKAVGFCFSAGSDDFDVTLDEPRTVVGRVAGCLDLRGVFAGLDLSLPAAIWPSLA
jgi:hypothetical protein